SPAESTLASGAGSFKVTLNTAGTQSVTAKDKDTPSIIGAQTGIVVNPTGATQLLIGGLPSPSKTTAGTPVSFTVTADDAHGNVATGYGGTVHFTTGTGTQAADPKATLPGDYPFVASDHGVHTFAAT